LVAIENVLLAAVSVFALVLTVIAVIAFRRTSDRHLVFLGAAFGVFFVKGLLLTIFLFSQTIDLRQVFLLSGFLDLVILALFYGFTLRR
jgi:ABC-type cobalamin transport system permease subunit